MTDSPTRKEDEKRLCPPGLIPHRSDVHKKFSSRFTPLSIVVTCLHLEHILTGREIRITRSCKGNMTGVVPLGFKAFQFVNKLIPLASQIVDNGKPDIKKFLLCSCKQCVWLFRPSSLRCLLVPAKYRTC